MAVPLPQPAGHLCPGGKDSSGGLRVGVAYPLSVCFTASLNLSKWTHLARTVRAPSRRAVSFTAGGRPEFLSGGGELVKAYSNFVACQYLKAACACFMKRDLDGDDVCVSGQSELTAFVHFTQPFVDAVDWSDQCPYAYV